MLNSGCVDFKALMLELRLCLYQLGDFLNGASQSELALVGLRTVPVGPAHLHDLVDHHEQVLAGNTDPVRVLHDFGGIFRVLHQKHHKSGYGI